MASNSQFPFYIIGLGSNRRHGRHGAPEHVLRAAVVAIRAEGFAVLAVSAIMRSAALGPSHREFANAALILQSELTPPDVLRRLKAIERAFGRRSGRRWGARVLDLDILAWSAGAWPPRPRRAAPGRLAVPHRALATRRFALHPAAALAPGWHHPHLGATLRQLDARLAARVRLTAVPQPNRDGPAHGIRARSSVGRATDF